MELSKFYITSSAVIIEKYINIRKKKVELKTKLIKIIKPKSALHYLSLFRRYPFWKQSQPNFINIFIYFLIQDKGVESEISRCGKRFRWFGLVRGLGPLIKGSGSEKNGLWKRAGQVIMEVFFFLFGGYN